MEKYHLARKLTVILYTDLVGANIHRYRLKIENCFMLELDVIEEACSQGHA
jgi:hypothetical protein